MVIGPKELLEEIRKDDAKELENLESRIDKGLRKKYDGSNYVTFSASLFSNVRKNSLNSLLDRYKAQGWEVKYISDQRDGSFYQFSSNDHNFKRY